MGVHGGYVHTESGEAHGGVSGRHSQWTTTISSSTRSLMQPAIPAGAVACLSILRTARKWYPRSSRPKESIVRIQLRCRKADVDDRRVRVAGLNRSRVRCDFVFWFTG